MFEIEYVDPADSMCDECKCSFGIHLMTCSKFKKSPLSKSRVQEPLEDEEGEHFIGYLERKPSHE